MTSFIKVNSRFIDWLIEQRNISTFDFIDVYPEFMIISAMVLMEKYMGVEKWEKKLKAINANIFLNEMLNREITVGGLCLFHWWLKNIEKREL